MKKIITLFAALVISVVAFSQQNEIYTNYKGLSNPDQAKQAWLQDNPEGTASVKEDKLIAGQKKSETAEQNKTTQESSSSSDGEAQELAKIEWIKNNSAEYNAKIKESSRINQLAIRKAQEKLDAKTATSLNQKMIEEKLQAIQQYANDAALYELKKTEIMKQFENLQNQSK